MKKAQVGASPNAVGLVLLICNRVIARRDNKISIHCLTEEKSVCLSILLCKPHVCQSKCGDVFNL